jgi:hypothetical protein
MQSGLGSRISYLFWQGWGISSHSAGGITKKRQSADIAIAKANWAEYKKRKRRGSN